MDKLDSLLLVLPTSLAILFSIAAQFGERWLVPLIPIIISVFIMPIYVGYIRGAIPDCLEERIRGWVYFVAGIFYFGGSYFYWGFGRTIITRAYDTGSIDSLALFIITMLSIAFVLLAVDFAYLVASRIFAMGGRRVLPIKLHKKITRTIWLAFTLSQACFSLAVSLDLIVQETLDIALIVPTGLAAAVFFLVFCYYESRYERSS